jgi:hypothetical protein
MEENSRRKKSSHIPWTSSTLTKALEPSLSKHANIAFICCIDPSKENIRKAAETLKFAELVPNITTNVPKSERLTSKPTLAPQQLTNSNTMSNPAAAASKENTHLYVLCTVVCYQGLRDKDRH